MPLRREKFSVGAGPRIHLWVPGLFALKGGIETYSAHLLDALRELHPDCRLDVFSKHDVSQTLDRFAAAGMRFHCAGETHLRARTLKFAAQLFAQGLLQRPDLIITTHLNFSPVARRLKQLCGVPYWVVAHGVEAWDLKRPDLRGALAHADRVLAVSRYTRERLLAEQRLDPQRVSVQSNTIDAARFQIGAKPAALLARYGLAPGQPVVLTVARLSKGEQYKGYDTIIRALPAVRHSVPDVRYIIVGKGDDRARVEELVAELKLEGCVTLAGFVPDGELAEHYNLCDVFAMPSKGEGFGIVYLEALACGKPVLAGNCDASPEAVCNGTLGALVNPDDAEEIAATLSAVLRREYPNPVLYQPAQLRERMLQAYGLDRFKQTLAAHLKGFWASRAQHPREVYAVKG